MVERTVVLGDVVGSREADDRRALGGRLRTACESINESAAVDVVVPFVVLKGVDEVGGVIASARHVYDVFDRFSRAVRPQALRLAAVTGQVDVGVDSSSVAGMDGPAFHRADALLSEIEAAERPFGLDTGNRPLDTAVADVVTLLSHLRLEWTDRQREVVERLGESGTQADVADELGVSQQAVSNVLDAANWHLIRTVEDRLRTTLQAYDR